MAAIHIYIYIIAKFLNLNLIKYDKKYYFRIRKPYFFVLKQNNFILKYQIFIKLVQKLTKCHIYNF